MTFLFTDLEGSTRLWERYPASMGDALARHDALVRAAIESAGGLVFKTLGDEFRAIFTSSASAVAAALAIQRGLASEPWGETGPLRTRIALHAGEAEQRGLDYFGTTLNRCARLLSAAHGGQVLLSRAAVALAGDCLPEGASLIDLGHHRLRDLSAPEHVYALAHPDLPIETRPLRGLAPCAHGLPEQLSSFVGRVTEVPEIRAMLEASRLVTLRGAGGCGKTRLALRVAAGIADRYPEGVWFVDLSLATSGLAVDHALGRALGLPILQTADPLAPAIDHLREHEALLVLDNCEHVIGHVAALTQRLLEQCRRVRVLATSREELRLRGECVFEVEPLAKPPDGPAGPIDELATVESVALFLERAREADRGFRLREANAEAVVAICRQTEGIPLALELAAARVALLSPARIAAMLGERLLELPAVDRAAPLRQRTLHNLIAWSYDLLEPREQRLFRRLAVFRDGFTLEAATTVCSEPEDGPWEVVDRVQRLLEKSMVTRDPRAPDRFRLLDPVRAFGAAALTEEGEEAAALASHCRCLAEIAHTLEPGDAREIAQSAGTLALEHGNLVAALTWAAKHAAAVAGTMLQHLKPHWPAVAYWPEVRAAAECVAGAAALAVEERARAFVASGYLELVAGSPDRAAAQFDAALILSEAEGLRESVMASLQGLGGVARARGDLKEARRHLGACLDVARTSGPGPPDPALLTEVAALAHAEGDTATACAIAEEGLAAASAAGKPGCAAACHSILGYVASAAGDQDRARACLEEAARIQTRLGLLRDLAATKVGLADVALAVHEVPLARAHLLSALEIQRELGDRLGEEVSLHDLGIAELAAGNAEAAIEYLCEGLAIADACGVLPGLADGLDSLSASLLAAGRPEPAACLLGAAEALRARTGLGRGAAERAEHERALARAEEALGSSRLREAMASGADLRVPDAIALARH